MHRYHAYTEVVPAPLREYSIFVPLLIPGGTLHHAGPDPCNLQSSWVPNALPEATDIASALFAFSETARLKAWVFRNSNQLQILSEPLSYRLGVGGRRASKAHFIINKNKGKR